MGEITETEIPARLEEIGPEWLTEGLRERGRLADARISKIELEPLGDGEGFLGVVARLYLEFEGEAGDTPLTTIAKLPTPVPENRIMGELMGLYWREIYFYDQLASQMPIRTPELHHAALTEDPMRFKQYGIVRVLDKLPRLFVDPMMTYAKKSMKDAGHRYVLLIEDLAPARIGDQVNGGDPETCAQVLEAAARMHAHFWQSHRLDRFPWLAEQDVNPRIRHRMYLEARDRFVARFADVLEGRGMECVRWNDAFGAKLGGRVHREAPHTLIHCDLRLDNVFFDETRSDDPVVLGDWQLVGRGAAAYDVAYFISGALDEDAPPDVEEALLRDYHRALERAGIGGYGFDRLLRDYRRSLLAVWQILGTSESMELGEDRGVDLMEIWVRRALARLRNVPLDELL